MGQSGEKSEFRVHSPEAYELELWRYGWKKSSFANSAGTTSTDRGPRADHSRWRLLAHGRRVEQFGYANPALKQYVTAPDRSDCITFTREPDRAVFFVSWVVAPAAPQHKLAVLASNITWNTYNAFGAAAITSTSTNCPSCRRQCAAGARSVHRSGIRHYAVEEYAPLSFERPESINFVPENEQVTDPIEGRTACHLAPAEWRLLGWLEREGFEYDFYAETQFHFRTFQTRRLPGADHQHASGILVARHVQPAQELGS